MPRSWHFGHSPRLFVGISIIPHLSFSGKIYSNELLKRYQLLQVKFFHVLLHVEKVDVKRPCVALYSPTQHTLQSWSHGYHTERKICPHKVSPSIPGQAHSGAPNLHGAILLNVGNF